MRKNIFALLTIIVLTMLVPGKSVYADDVNFKSDTVKAKVIEVEDKTENDMGKELVRVSILEGSLKGRVVEFDHMVIKGSQYNVPLKSGMIIYVIIQHLGNEMVSYGFAGISRIKEIEKLTLVFIVCILLFGGFKGLRSVLSLAITGVLIYKLLIPWIIKGYSPIVSTVVVSTGIIILSFIIIEGFTVKGFTAMFGTICGTILAGVMSMYYGNATHITGLNDEVVQVLVTHISNSIDCKGLLFSGIIIGTLGAVMDVSMSIASVIFEIKMKKPNIGALSLMRSGLKVGKDILATMTNTLILAYASVSLPFFILNVYYDMPLTDLINSEYVTVEIIRALCGSIGLIATIPITASIATLKVK